MAHLSTYMEARKVGAQQYSSGKPCKNGHVSPRYTANQHCIECHRERNGKWMNDRRAANRDHFLGIERAYKARIKEKLGEHIIHKRSKSYNLFHKYGIHLDDYERMLSEQNGVCAICSSPPVSSKRNKGYLDVDHDHVSGVIRGLICHPCNQGMIAVDRIPDWLEKAANYAAKYRRA